MKKQLSALILIIMMGPSYLWAADDQFLLEVDPLTFVQKGYSLHTRYIIDKFAVGVGTYALDLPKPIVEINTNNKGWEDRINKAYIVFFDYLIDEKIEGWIIGTEITSQEHQVSFAGETAEFKSTAYLARVGYHFTPFGNNLYFFPWFGVGSTGLTSGTTTLPVSGKTFDFTNTTAFATLHVGWSF